MNRRPERPRGPDWWTTPLASTPDERLAAAAEWLRVSVLQVRAWLDARMLRATRGGLTPRDLDAFLGEFADEWAAEAIDAAGGFDALPDPWVGSARQEGDAAMRARDAEREHKRTQRKKV